MVSGQPLLRPWCRGLTSAGEQRECPGDIQRAKILVDEQRFEPAKINLRAGTPARLTFLRITDKTCSTEVAVPSLNVKRALPLNVPVNIEFTPEKTG